MPALDLFLPLLKVDLDRRLVSGVATAETPDRAGEIFDYASSKPYFEQWSAEALAASGGKSLGAVRAMHGPVAAGKLTDIAFDDAGKRITVAAKIVDDDEWRKVQEGVYTGFSQGGRYVKRWPDADTGLTRYTAEPHEISLVDLPCVRDATFEVVKNGVVEKRAFAARPEADAPGQETAAVTAPIDQTLDAIDAALGAEKREFSAAEREKAAEAGVAMPDGSYPIKSAKDVENAVRDYNRSGQKPDVKAHIIARAKAIGAESALPDDWTKRSEKSAAPIDAALGAEKREFSAAEREKDAEAGVAMRDGSYPIKSAKDVENAVGDYNRSGQKPDVKAHIIARAKAIGAESALPGDWTKRSEKSAAPIVAPSAPHNAPEALAKAAAALAQAARKLERAAEENTVLRKALDDLSPALADLKKRIAALEAQPLPAKAALRSVPKTADGAHDALVSADDAVRRLASLPAEERALALTKLSLANPALRRL